MKTDKKAAIVERFNRTLKTMVWKYFYSKGTYNWVDVLDELTENYNTKHGNILMKPADVNKSNENLVWVTLYGSALGKLPLPKFRVGDTVRVSRYKSIFSKVHTHYYQLGCRTFNSHQRVKSIHYFVCWDVILLYNLNISSFDAWFFTK